MYLETLQSAGAEEVRQMLGECRDLMVVIRHFPHSFIGLSRDKLLLVRHELSSLSAPSIGQMHLLGILIGYENRISIDKRTVCNDEQMPTRLLEALETMRNDGALLPWIERASTLNPMLVWQLFYDILMADPSRFFLSSLLLLAQGVMICLWYFARLSEQNTLTNTQNKASL